MKKIMCPKCEEVFEVDENRDILPNGCVKCKKCHELIYLADGENKLQNEFKRATSAAYKDLYYKQAYEQAAGEYEYALTLKENDLGALVGSMLAKIYASKLNEREFLNIIETIDKHDIVLDAENTFIYLSFVRDAIYSFEQFLKMCSQNLTNNDVFYNKEYFSYYKDGIIEINKVMKYFKDSLSLLDEEEYKSFINENTLFNKDFETMENGINHRLNNNYKVYGYGLVHLSAGKEELINDDKYNITIPSDIDLSLLPVNKKAVKIRKMMILYFVVLTILILTFLIIFFVSKNNLFVYLCAIPVVLALGGYFMFTYLIKKCY